MKTLKKFFWYILIPVGLFILANIFRKDTTELNKQVKEKKKEIKETEKEIKTKEKTHETTEKELDKNVEETKKVMKDNIEKKEIRDEEAKKFFPDL